MFIMRVPAEKRPQQAYQQLQNMNVHFLEVQKPAPREEYSSPVSKMFVPQYSVVGNAALRSTLISFTIIWKASREDSAQFLVIVRPHIKTSIPDES